MPLSTVTYNYDFSLSDLGFTYSGLNPGFYGWDSTTSSLRWWGATGAGDYNTITSPSITWAGMGVPAGNHVLYCDFSIQVKVSNGANFQYFPGVTGNPTGFVPFPAAGVGDEAYHTYTFTCAPFCIDLAYQGNTTPFNVALRQNYSPTEVGYVWITDLTVTAYYQAEALSTCAGMVTTPSAATVTTGASIIFESLPRPALWSVVEGGGGTVSSSGPATTVTYTAPLVPGLYTLRATDPEAGCFAPVDTPITVTDVPPAPGERPGSLYPVSAYGQTPYLLVARRDLNQVAALDLYTGVKQRVKWQTIPLDGGPEHLEDRSVRKRFKRFRLYGEGTLDGAEVSTLTFIADKGQRVQVYRVTPSQSYPQEGILILQETAPNLIGRQVEVLVDIVGTGLTLREIQMEYSTLN